MPIPQSDKIWFNGNFVNWGRCQNSCAIPCDTLRFERFRGDPLLSNGARAGVFQAWGSRQQALRFRQNLPLGHSLHARPARRRHFGDDPREPVASVLRPPRGVSGVWRTGRQPDALPCGSGDRGVGMGQVPRPRGIGKRRLSALRVVESLCPQHHAVTRQSGCELHERPS